MADKTIGSLPQAQTVDDASLFVCEQQGVAMKTTGAQWKGFAQASVSQYVGQAEKAATKAGESAVQATQSAEAAQQSAEDAAESAQSAKDYSGKPPMIQNGTWWIWNAETQDYEDTGQAARGDVMYATFDIDTSTGQLVANIPDGYNGPTFKIVDGILEVTVNG